MNQIQILIVEDEFLLAADISNKLQRLGYRVLASVFTGQEAIEQAKAQPDLIFMDIKLKGGMDGIETATKIRELYHIPVVYLTSYADDETLERAEQTGCYGYIIKPCDERELKAIIKIALKKHQELSELAVKLNPLNANNSIGYSHYWKTYANSFNSVDRELIALNTDLDLAIERNELQLYYQPKVSLKTGKVIGAEALLRWNHPTRGMVSPSLFIMLAEKTNSIQKIGEWVLDRACKQMRVWQSMSLDMERMAINLSACQLDRQDLNECLLGIIESSNLDPCYLELELTESSLVKDPEKTSAQLDFFRSLGIKISIDDFGKGYSSLSYIQQFPFDTLKIDSSFIKEIQQNSRNATIATSLIQMAHRLDLDVIAEGVETQAELAFLVRHQCDAIQGYLFSPPLPSDKFEQLLMRHHSLLDGIIAEEVFTN
jgi:EAL domain-containing protein (putative c-di-GMP-specific phosphodiesterase class I)/CheY-like chemotaxis protein